MVQNILTLEQALSLNTDSFDLARALSSPELFIEVAADETLASALAKIESSHEPVFVKNSDDFLGLLSLTNALYKSRLPHGTKVKRIMFAPPKLIMSSDIFEVAEAMQATRIYALPVFIKEKVAGVIELATVLKWLIVNKHNVSALAGTLEIKKPITIAKSAGVREALEIFKKRGVSRLIVVDEQGSLEGILTRNQLRKAYLSPSSRQRFGNTQNPKTRLFDPAEVVKRDDTPIMRLYTSAVFTGQSFWEKEEIISRLVESDFNSAVIVDLPDAPAKPAHTTLSLKGTAVFGGIEIVRG